MRALHNPPLSQSELATRVRELATRASASQCQISRYESGLALPDVETAMSIAIALNTTVEGLFWSIQEDLTRQKMSLLASKE